MALSEFPNKMKRVNRYLKDNPIIDDLCFIPLHLAILIYLFRWQNKLPETLTELNELFTLHTVYRSLKKTLGKNAPNIGAKLRDLPQKYYSFVQKLCKLAYEGVKSHHLLFTSDEIMKVCPEISDYPDGLGLLEETSHYCTTEIGETNSYSFLHFTMQEFLAYNWIIIQHKCNRNETINLVYMYVQYMALYIWSLP